MVVFAPVWIERVSVAMYGLVFGASVVWVGLVVCYLVALLVLCVG